MVTERITKRQQEKEALEAQLAVEQKKELLLSADEVKSFLTKLQKGDYRNPVHRRFTIYLNGSNQPIVIEYILLDEVENYFDSQISDNAECSSLVADAPSNKKPAEKATCFVGSFFCYDAKAGKEQLPEPRPKAMYLSACLQ